MQYDIHSDTASKFYTSPKQAEPEKRTASFRMVFFRHGNFKMFGRPQDISTHFKVKLKNISLEFVTRWRTSKAKLYHIGLKVPPVYSAPCSRSNGSGIGKLFFAKRKKKRILLQQVSS